MAGAFACLGSVCFAGVDFTRQVQPILAEHCLECHGPDAAKGGVNLATREGALKAAKSGAHAVVPGEVKASELIARIVHTDLDERMPPKEKKALKPAEVEVLKQWIAEGAVYDLHWAYKPLTRPALPPNTDGHPIDRFILAKLAEHKIAPSPEADRITLIKRVHYDLLGLPPTPEEADAFMKDRAPDAYERMVDRALASEHYGERWGRHWLDAARYADSDGYEKDRPRPDAWRYRDWVIRAVNEDMPFDQFTIEQLAGDLLPDATEEQVVATAFNRQTLTNTEGGTDQEQFRVEACMDRTETVGTVWLGLTVGCARCHTHKYDQITQKEYYQMFAFFNNGDEVTKQVPRSPEEWADYEKKNGAEVRKLKPLQKKLDDAKAMLPTKLPEWEKGVQARLAKARESKAAQTFAPVEVASITADSGAKLTRLDDGSYLTSGKAAQRDLYRVKLTAQAKPITAFQIEALPDDSLPLKGAGRHKNGNFVLGEVRATSGNRVLPLHSAAADYVQTSFKAADVFDGNSETGWAVGGKTTEKHVLTFQIAEPVMPGQTVTLELEQHYAKQPGHVLGRFRVLAAAEETEASIMPEAVAKILTEEPKRRNPVVIRPLWDWMEKVDVDVVAAARALSLAQAKLPKPPLMDVRVIGQRVTSPRETKLLYRGDFLQPAEAVEPGALAVLPAVNSSASQRPASPSRLDFARWLVSRENPLTPRVTVNLIWGKLFGEGLVRTVADFGVRGEKPTHPELLDWLAAEFMEQGWSRKKMLKTMIMSAAYRRSSAHRPELLEVDPKNALLHRQNRLRVEAEIVRDLGLAASGLLSRKVGGPSVFPPMPADIAALSYAGNFSWTISKDADRYRRGMYTFFKRTAPYPDLTAFDCPDANLTNVRRTVSNTPLQALTTLNAEAFHEAAQALARRVLSESHAGDEARIERCFRLCLVRAPSPEEIAALKKLLAESREWYAANPEDAVKMAANDAIKETPAAETAAWAATARIVLNMDEFITRE